MASDLWLASVDLLKRRVLDFVVLFFIFIVITFLIITIFGAIENYVVSTSLSTAALINYYSTLSTGSTYAPFYTGYVLTFGIASAISAFILLWFIGTLFTAMDTLNSNKPVDYIGSVIAGLNKVFSNLLALIVVIVLGFIGGLVSALLFSPIGLGAYMGDYLLSAFVSGLFIALYTGIALVALRGKTDMNFITVLQNISRSSNNAGLYVLAAIGIAIIPYLQYIQFILIPMAVVIIYLSRQ
jgi:hypothetical protein